MVVISLTIHMCIPSINTLEFLQYISFLRISIYYVYCILYEIKNVLVLQLIGLELLYKIIYSHFNIIKKNRRLQTKQTATAISLW